MKKVLSLFVILILTLAPVFASEKAPKSLPERPAKEDLREFQTKKFSTTNQIAIMKAIINVLQDDFFFIEQTDSKIGFILASKEVDTKDPYTNIKETFGCSKKMTGIKRYSFARTEANINVTLSEKETSVRVSFRKKVLNMYDVEIKIKDVFTEEDYSNFFKKVETELKSYNLK